MAGTIIIGTFGDNGEVSFEADYDDNLDVVSFKCRNGSDLPAFGVLVKNDAEGAQTTQQWAITAQPGEIEVVEVPQGPNGIRLIPGGKPGVYSGYSASLRY